MEDQEKGEGEEEEKEKQKEQEKKLPEEGEREKRSPAQNILQLNTPLITCVFQSELLAWRGSHPAAEPQQEGGPPNLSLHPLIVSGPLRFIGSSWAPLHGQSEGLKLLQLGPG